MAEANARAGTGPAAPREQGVVPFGSNELRLGARTWIVTLVLAGVVLGMVPRYWARWERFETGRDYRIPYPLSRDYWLYARRLRQVTEPSNIVLLGDSVVWGEYVLPEGTWSAFLNRASASGHTFVNGGVNGLFPLAMEGLVERYAVLPRGQRVILHCNLLWMTSAQADLSSTKEETFNHSRLVPQFRPWIPCYRADASERLGAWLQHRVGFLGWASHLQDAYFDGKSIPAWTLADDGGDPARYTNAWRNPMAAVTGVVPGEPVVDPMRGPGSPRHRPWSTNAVGTTRFEWVDPGQSLQWAAFQRVVRRLRARGNDVLVVVGPFNEHLMSPDSRFRFQGFRELVVDWLKREGVPHLRPPALPSRLYADASHPLTEGYELLSAWTLADPMYQRWLAGGMGSVRP